MIPLVAIVGRPNVGKSTLFNRLVGRKVAIVHDEPGVTRDRHYADVHAHSRTFTVIDTGGFDPDETDAIGQGIVRHIRAAIDEADVVLCVLDGQNPATEADAQAVRMLRRSEKPVLYAANRIDVAGQEALVGELCRLGIDPLPISGLHGRGIGRLCQAIAARLPPPDPALLGHLVPASEEDEGEEEAEPSLAAASGEAEGAGEGREPAVGPTGEQAPGELRIKVALIGRPNAGKSSLLNRLSGTERSLVDSRPGTTRDPIDADLDFKGQRYAMVDTAGIRRRARVEAGVESQSVMRALKTIERGDVVIVLCDAAGGLAEQDARLLGLCAERGRAVVVGLNKRDLLTDAEAAAREADARHQLHFAPWVPIVSLSTQSGHGVTRLMNQVRACYAQYSRRIGTGELNRFLQETVERQPPPRSGPRAPRLFFMTQASAMPPVFVVMCSNGKAVREVYRRFLVNQVRKTFGYDSVPIAVRFRSRRRRDAPE